MSKRITDSQANAVQAMRDNYVESICVCNKPGIGKGFQGHDKGCWVHIFRANIKKVDSIFKP